MRNITKNILTGVVALSLLTPVTTTALIHNPRIIIQAKRHHRSHKIRRYRAKHHRIRRRYHKAKKSKWHKGVPRIIEGNDYWFSNKINHYHDKTMPYEKSVIWFQHNQVEMATDNYYRSKKYLRRVGVKHSHWLMSNGAGEWWNPTYKYVGHHLYKLHAGDKAPDGNNYLVKVHNRKSASVWIYRHGLSGKKSYLGDFHLRRKF